MCGDTTRTELTREAVKVDGTEEAEKFNSVLWELGEVFIDHLEGALKHILHDCGYLIFHKSLDVKSARVAAASWYRKPEGISH
jgi:hypothetical protein